jgi:dephospho-CoA kinase
VLDAAVLFEAGWDDLCDVTVFVDAPLDQRQARLARQRSWSDEAVKSREEAQAPLEEKRRRCTAALRNDAGPDELRTRVESLWQQFLTRSSRNHV